MNKINSNQIDNSGTTTIPASGVILNGGDTTFQATSTNTHQSGSTTTLDNESIVSNQSDETFGAGYEGVYQSGSTTDFQAGATVDFTGATVTGLPASGSTLLVNPVIGTTALLLYTDDVSKMAGNTNTNLFLQNGVGVSQTRDTTTEYAAASIIRGVVVIGSFTYALLTNNAGFYVIYRYPNATLNTAGTLMTLVGQNFGINSSVWMTSNGTDFFFTHNAGNSASANALGRYSLAGTVLTFVSTTTYGALAAGFTLGNFSVYSGNECVTIDTTFGFRYFDGSGVLISSDGNPSSRLATYQEQLINVANTVFCQVQGGIFSPVPVI